MRRESRALLYQGAVARLRLAVNEAEIPDCTNESWCRVDIAAGVLVVTAALQINSAVYPHRTVEWLVRHLPCPFEVEKHPARGTFDPRFDISFNIPTRDIEDSDEICAYFMEVAR